MNDVKRIVIIGCNTAGTMAAIQARKTNKNAEIWIVSREKYPEYSPCGLPYIVSGAIKDFKDLIVHPIDFYEKTLRVSLMLNTEALDINTSRKSVLVKNLITGKENELEYDSLILATGAKPALLPIKGINKKGVFSIRTINDVESLLLHLKKITNKLIVIIGAGLIGMEMAEALRIKGYEVLVLEILPEILPAMLDPDMAYMVHKKAEENGIKILTNTTLDEIIGDDKVKAVIVKSEKILTETIIVATRVNPEVDLAKKVGISIGEMGGIKVNEYLQTSIKDIYAAGDCIETFDLISKKSYPIQLATTAARQGIVAGTNAAGGMKKYPGSTGVTTTKLFGLEIATVGVNSSLATKLGIKSTSTRITALTKAHYYPNAKSITIKLIADIENKRIIGAQFIGEEGAALRANLVALAIKANVELSELEFLETCYAPPVSPLWDPLSIAAQALSKKLYRL
ncbi:MAG: FAD-dependent oxidoreductase [Candidatus Bathyarchaeia archaeon]